MNNFSTIFMSLCSVAFILFIDSYYTCYRVLGSSYHILTTAITISIRERRDWPESREGMMSAVRAIVMGDANVKW